MRKVFTLQLLLLLGMSTLLCVRALAQSPPAPLLPPLHDGSHDFDPLLGNFTFHLRRMLHPLTSSPEWTELTGTVACYKVWDGRGQLDTVEVDGASGHVEGLTLRLYDPASRQWRLYWANNRIGRLDPPQIGAFQEGRGDFYTTDTINDKTTLIRYDWSRMASGTPHFEQAFSPDGGRTWEVNWITDQTRTGDAPWGQPQPGRPSTPLPGSAGFPATGIRDAQHDFDFELGAWKIHIRRLVHPLTGSKEWTEMDGTSVTNKIWDGRASTILRPISGTSTSPPATTASSVSRLSAGSAMAGASFTTRSSTVAATSSSASPSGRSPRSKSTPNRLSPRTVAPPGRSTGSTPSPAL